MLYVYVSPPVTPESVRLRFGPEYTSLMGAPPMPGERSTRELTTSDDVVQLRLTSPTFASDDPGAIVGAVASYLTGKLPDAVLPATSVQLPVTFVPSPSGPE